MLEGSCSAEMYLSCCILHQYKLQLLARPGRAMLCVPEMLTSEEIGEVEHCVFALSASRRICTACDWITGVASALSAAFMIACAIISIKFMSKGESPLSIAVWFHTASILLGTIPLAVRPYLCRYYYLASPVPDFWCLVKPAASILKSFMALGSVPHSADDNAKLLTQLIAGADRLAPEACCA